MSDETNQGSPTPPPPPPQEQPTPPPESPQGPAASGVSENRTLMLILSYFGLLALIPWLVEKNDQEVQWHAKHGLVLLVSEVILFVGLEIVSLIFAQIFGPLGCLVSVLTLILVFVVLAFHVACILKALKGERLLVPKISEFADRF